MKTAPPTWGAPTIGAPLQAPIPTPAPVRSQALPPTALRAWTEGSSAPHIGTPLPWTRAAPGPGIGAAAPSPIPTPAPAQVGKEAASPPLTRSASVLNLPPRHTHSVAPTRHIPAGHPEVFRWQYYLSEHPALREAGIHTRDRALAHWKAHGIREGRHAHPAFSPHDYLRLHPDVQEAARDAGASPLRFAITHWLQHGQREGRQGRIVAPPEHVPLSASAPEPAPTPAPLTGLAARLAQIMEGAAAEPPSDADADTASDAAPSYLNVELPPALQRLLKRSE